MSSPSRVTLTDVNYSHILRNSMDGRSVAYSYIIILNICIYDILRLSNQPQLLHNSQFTIPKSSQQTPQENDRLPHVPIKPLVGKGG
jgi:hypothetical protein